MKKLCTLLLVLLCMTAAFGQSGKEKREAASERIVKGTVTSAAGQQVNGAVVQLKDVRTLEVRSFITQQAGAYHFTGLKMDDDYQLKADFNDTTSGWKTLSVFDSRKQPVINLKLDKKSQ